MGSSQFLKSYRPGKYKNFDDVIEYAKSIQSRKKIACKELQQAIDRFFEYLDNPDYELSHEGPEFCIKIIESTLCHQQGEAIDGTPLRGSPFILQPWQKFIVYNLLGFLHKGTKNTVFKESLIYIPRKNGKTSFVAALAWSLSLWYRQSLSKCYIASNSLQQSLESFNFLNYNIDRIGEKKQRGKPGGLVKVIDNNNEHSMQCDLKDGSFYIRALAGGKSAVDKQDSLNGNIAILDEIHAFTQSKQYNLFREMTKAYTNKLVLGISTAGDNEQAFLGQRLKYCRSILDGTVKDDQYFLFMCCAPKDDDGEVDFTNPVVHEMANPSYGVTIRPEEMKQQSIEAMNDPQQRKDFFAKSLNVYTNSMKAWFKLEEFQNSDKQYSWNLEELAKLPIKWYGGADLSRVYDLTAAVLIGNYHGVDICIAHAFMPVTQATIKADEDNIPFFQWKDNGWLTLCNSPTVSIDGDVVNWFIDMRRKGFKIHSIGYDRKFCEEFIPAMKKSGFRCYDQPQYFYLKSMGFKHIERKVKNGQFYYLNNQAYLYCVGNVHAIEKQDDAIQYEKCEPHARMDLFDASVFATIQMINAEQKQKKAAQWWNESEGKKAGDET